MKKSLFLFLFIPLIASCNKASINIPKSPFNDSYKRIGMSSKYNGNINSLTSNEYEFLKTNITDYKGDAKVFNYTTASEVRDLKYAYFGSENSSISKCTMDSRKSESNRYNNLVTIVKDNTNTQKQTDNGIIATNSLTNTYTFSPETDKYQINVEKKYNNEEIVVSKGEKKDCTTSSEKELRFGLTPYKNIVEQHFTELDKFKILGENAVYGKINYEGSKYIIKEAYSKFENHTTTSGRKYKSCNNYFYEALLGEKDNLLVFTNFRFYKEKLILSEAIDDTGIPVLYLEKPVLVEYSETEYNIHYDSLGDYKGNIPGKD